MRSAVAPHLRLAEPPAEPVRRRKDPTPWVGLLLIVALVGGLGLLFTMTDAAMFRGRYVVTTRVEDAAGIRKGDPVQLRGVNIGRILGFEIRPDGVVLRLEIEGEYAIPSDSRVQLRSGGLLGGTVAQVIPGRSEKSLSYGDALPGASHDSLGESTDRLVDGADAVLEQAQALLSDKTIADVHAGAADARKMLATLERAVREQRRELAELSSSLKRSAAGLEQATSGGELTRAVANVETASARAAAVSESLERSSRSLEGVLAKIERGEGTLGRLATDEALYDDLRAAARSLNATSDEVAGLVAAIKQNPKRYLKMSVF